MFFYCKVQHVQFTVWRYPNHIETNQMLVCIVLLFTFILGCGLNVKMHEIVTSAYHRCSAFVLIPLKNIAIHTKFGTNFFLLLFHCTPLHLSIVCIYRLNNFCSHTQSWWNRKISDFSHTPSIARCYCFRSIFSTHLFNISSLSTEDFEFLLR